MLSLSKRKMLGTSMVAAGALFSRFGLAKAQAMTARGRLLLDGYRDKPQGLVEACSFPLIEAIHGRRSRRFAKGASIPSGPLAFTSRNAPEPLTELEQMLLVSTIAGNTGWVELFAHHPDYGSKLPNYVTAAGGRSFPSSAGFNTSEFFFTDDTGVYFLPTRDMQPVNSNPDTDLKSWVAAHKARIVKLADGRLNIPRAMPHMEGHNTWCANVTGSTLIFPVADLAQHVILLLLYLVQNGLAIYDDVNNRPIPGLARYRHRLNLDGAYPMRVIEEGAITDVSVEMGSACYAGALMLQAMGLGGWMYTGLDPFTVLGASGDPAVPGLGFRFDMHEASPLPFFTGRSGVFEAHVPPHFASMRDAVESVVARKFGAGGPYNAGTAGPYKDNAAVRGSAAPLDDEAIEITTVMADYMLSTFGRFPATVPAIYVKTYLQAHRLDTDFYDQHFGPGAYLRTHAAHDRNWS